jgi:hypothetical protein
MAILGDINRLSDELGIKVSKIRNWKKAKIFTPMSVDPEDGKTLLYHIECEKMKYKIAKELRVDLSVEEIGDRFWKTFGTKNKELIKELERTDKDEKLIDRYVKEMSPF